MNSKYYKNVLKKRIGYLVLLVCVIAIGAISCNSNSYLIICSLYCVLPMISTIWKYTGRKIMEIVFKKLHFKYLLRTE